MSSDRPAYPRVIVNRLTLKDKVITSDGRFADNEGLPLPAQMVRFAAEMAAGRTKNSPGRDPPVRPRVATCGDGGGVSPACPLHEHRL